MLQAVAPPRVLTPPTQQRSVLLVEDDRSSRHALEALLRFVGYVPRAVGSAEEALRALQAHDLPAIVIVDLNLPGMDGLEFINQLRILDPDALVVLTTADDSSGLQFEIRRLGLRYLRKPIRFDQLLQVLRN